MRDLLNHGAGKGDKTRVSSPSNFRKRISEVKFSGKPPAESGFVLVRGKWVKKYS